MSNPNDDLDDQLYILLASLKEYREAIADDQKRLETFYTQVATGVLDILSLMPIKYITGRLNHRLGCSS